MTVIREIHAAGWCARLDLGPQVLEIEAPSAVLDWPPRKEDYDRLLPTPPLAETGPVSAAMLLLKAKQFDDGLCAAVQLAAQQGVGRFAGKGALLRSLAATLATGIPLPDAAATIFAACELGGISVAVPEAIKAGVRTLADRFLGNELASKPLGFYTWTPELSAIFRQDRLLQQPLAPLAVTALTEAVTATPGASDAYDACVRLSARLTNPPARAGLRDGGVFLPASCSHEQVLCERLFGDRRVPEGFELLGELIRRVQAGEISLAPTDRSGWYDHQTWSLEPLIVPDRTPEAARLHLGKRYRKNLEDLFRGGLALARETHVKDIAIAMAGCLGPDQPPIYVRPSLTIEPLPTMLARRTVSYRFVRLVVEEAFGSEALSGLHRLTPEGPYPLPLSDELMIMEQLFEGAAFAARRELGMEPAGDEAAARLFASWRANLATDPDLSSDCRMMVPVFYDLQRQKTKVWAFLGWRKAPVDVKYRTEPVLLGIEREQPPEQEAADRLGVLRRKFRPQPESQPLGPPAIEFCEERYEFAVPVLAEVYVSRLLDRDEFRRHCDQFGTREAILANLT